MPTCLQRHTYCILSLHMKCLFRQKCATAPGCMLCEAHRLWSQHALLALGAACYSWLCPCSPAHVCTAPQNASSRGIWLHPLTPACACRAPCDAREPAAASEVGLAG